MTHTELDLRERRAIEDMLNAKMPASKIAAGRRPRHPILRRLSPKTTVNQTGGGRSIAIRNLLCTGARL